MTPAESQGGVRQFGAFALTGGLAALVNWGSRIVISAQGVSFEIAVVIAYLFGMATAYLLSRLFVFEKSGRSVSSEVWRFSLVNVVALGVVWLVSVSLENWLLPAAGWSWRTPEVAHAIGVASPVLTSYMGHRYFTFRSAQASPAGATNEAAVKPGEEAMHERRD